MTKDDHPPEPSLPSSSAHQSEESCNGDYGTFSCSGLLDGWDYCLEDVWWSRFRQQPKRRGSGDNTENDLCRTVPTEYYSRHQMLKAESPAYILPPSSHGQKGAAPVYTYRPGTSTTQLQKSWPTRAHDGSMEQKNINRRESLGYSEGEST